MDFFSAFACENYSLSSLAGALSQMFPTQLHQKADYNNNPKLSSENRKPFKKSRWKVPAVTITWCQSHPLSVHDLGSKNPASKYHLSYDQVEVEGHPMETCLVISMLAPEKASGLITVCHVFSLIFPSGIVRASSVFPILSTVLLLLGGLCVGAGRIYSSKNNIILSAGILFVAAGMFLPEI